MPSTRQRLASKREQCSNALISFVRKQYEFSQTHNVISLKSRLIDFEDLFMITSQSADPRKQSLLSMISTKINNMKRIIQTADYYEEKISNLRTEIDQINETLKMNKDFPVVPKNKPGEYTLDELNVRLKNLMKN